MRMVVSSTLDFASTVGLSTRPAYHFFNTSLSLSDLGGLIDGSP